MTGLSYYVLDCTTTFSSRHTDQLSCSWTILEQCAEQINNDLHSTATAVDSCVSPKEKFVAVSREVDTAPVIAVCTTLMKRVHHLIKHSAEVVFGDAGGNMDH